jgi:5-hydroxyisourate hydrolase
MISTHVLDTSIGRPAADIMISLEKKEIKNLSGEGSGSNTEWIKIGSGTTDCDGRLSFNCPKEKGIYRLVFGLEEYFKNNKAKHNLEDFFFLDTPIVFQIINTDRLYHVPLLLNPFGYTTYRGS